MIIAVHIRASRSVWKYFAGFCTKGFIVGITSHALVSFCTGMRMNFFTCGFWSYPSIDVSGAIILQGLYITYLWRDMHSFIAIIFTVLYCPALILTPICVNRTTAGNTDQIRIITFEITFSVPFWALITLTLGLYSTLVHIVVNSADITCQHQTDQQVSEIDKFYY